MHVLILCSFGGLHCDFHGNGPLKEQRTQEGTHCDGGLPLRLPSQLVNYWNCIQSHNCALLISFGSCLWLQYLSVSSFHSRVFAIFSGDCLCSPAGCASFDLLQFSGCSKYCSVRDRALLNCLSACLLKWQHNAVRLLPHWGILGS